MQKANSYLSNIEKQAVRKAVSEVVTNELKLRRKKLGLTQREVAAAAGIHVVSLCRLETGFHHPHPATFEKVLAAIARLGSDMA